MYRSYTMAALAARSMIQLSFALLTLGIVSALALFLGAVGLYGVLSCAVAERTREIGVRMALGATAATVRRMVVAQGARVVAVGVVIGLLAALAATRPLAAHLFGVTPVDAPTFAAMAVAHAADRRCRRLRPGTPSLPRRPLPVAAQRLGLRRDGSYARSAFTTWAGASTPTSF